MKNNLFIADLTQYHILATQEGSSIAVDLDASSTQYCGCVVNVRPRGWVKEVNGSSKVCVRVCARIGGVCARIGGVRARIGGVRARIGGVRARIGGVRARIGGVRARIGGVRARIGGVWTLIAFPCSPPKDILLGDGLSGLLFYPWAGGATQHKH